MKNYEFVVWLEGYIDLCDESELTAKKLIVIRNHLNLVKAVEGELGELNAGIYDIISSDINNNSSVEDLRKTHLAIAKKLSDFFHDNFPNGAVENVK